MHASASPSRPAEGRCHGGASGGNANVNHLERGSIVIDRLEHTATKDGKDLNLTPMEFELLFMLAAAAGEAISRSSLLKNVWGYENSGDTRLVNVHVQRLRAKVEDDPRTRKSCRPYVASATSSSLLNNEPAPSIQPQTLAAPRTR